MPQRRVVSTESMSPAELRREVNRLRRAILRLANASNDQSYKKAEARLFSLIGLRGIHRKLISIEMFATYCKKHGLPSQENFHKTT